MLIVVCIVALLTGAILRKNVLPAGVAARAAKGAPADEAGGAAPAATADGAAAAPADAVGRARGLEDSVRRQAADREQRIEAGTK